jgi:hypothetical protein
MSPLALHEEEEGAKMMGNTMTKGFTAALASPSPSERLTLDSMNSVEIVAASGPTPYVHLENDSWLGHCTYSVQVFRAAGLSGRICKPVVRADLVSLSSGATLARKRSSQANQGCSVNPDWSSQAHNVLSFVIPSDVSSGGDLGLVLRLVCKGSVFNEVTFASSAPVSLADIEKSIGDGVQIISLDKEGGQLEVVFRHLAQGTCPTQESLWDDGEECSQADSDDSYSCSGAEEGGRWDEYPQAREEEFLNEGGKGFNDWDMEALGLPSSSTSSAEALGLPSKSAAEASETEYDYYTGTNRMSGRFLAVEGRQYALKSYVWTVNSCDSMSSFASETSLVRSVDEFDCR